MTPSQNFPEDFYPEPSHPQPYYPQHCRPEAFHYFVQHFPHIRSTRSLVHCAVAASMHALEDLSPAWIDAEITRLVNAVRQQCTSDNPMAVVSHLHQILFEQENFAGCGEETYYHPRNSYFSLVLSTKRGLPIMLSLLYKAVAEELGLRVDGIRSPGHFLLRVFDGQGWLIVDPYQRGRVLDVQEVCTMIGKLFNQTLEPDPRYLPIAEHEQWIERILVNLAYAFDRLGCSYDCNAMNEILGFAHGK